MRRIMKGNPSLGPIEKILSLFFLSFLCLPFDCSSYDDSSSINSFTISSFSYPKSKLKPYDWSYLRVALAPSFSSISLSIDLDAHTDKSVGKLPKRSLLIICFRDGSLPLPDASTSSLDNLVLGPLTNDSIGGIRNDTKGEQCHLLSKHTMLSLTNEQISPGVMYVGLFNGIGPTRTQSKMISRGTEYSFSANFTAKGCSTSTTWGPYCNQTIDSLSCVQSDGKINLNNRSDGVIYKVNTCRTTNGTSCHGYNEPKVYSFDILGLANQLTITTTNTATNKADNIYGSLMLYARRGSIPSVTLYDYTNEISETPLIVPFPKIGRWYVAFLPINQTEVNKSSQENKSRDDLCYSLDLQVLECPAGKAGVNCTSQVYNLQGFLRKNPNDPFELYYLPITDKISGGSFDFPLEPLLSNSSLGENFTWTYFSLDIPRGANGGTIHIQLKSNTKMDYEIYSRSGGYPSLELWTDYSANANSSNKNNNYFKVYDSSDKKVSFYIIYPREGTWSFGVRHPILNGNQSHDQTTMSISLESCPNQCFNHGECRRVMDSTGLSMYSYCSCDRTHGGIDCSIEIVSPKEHIQQSIALIASNAAALLPAFWALRQKAFAEWILYTSSGISSALYHACDVGTWCVLSFHTLQFMDFWLSFIAVVSTFVYLATISEGNKRVIHTCVSILTALLAQTGATRSSNIGIVISIGAIGLLIGWLIEYSSKIRSHSCSTWLCSNILERQYDFKAGLLKIVKILYNRFRWGFLLAGFVALFMAGVSWKLETTQNYWFWHSMWHVSIYTSSFFFLCAKVSTSSGTATVNNEEQRVSAPTYELTRRDSSQRAP